MPSSTSILHSRAGRALAAAVAALALGTVLGLAALWPTERPGAPPEAQRADTVGARVVAVQAVPCRTPMARDCRLVGAALETGGTATFHAGEAVSDPEPAVGDEVRLARNDVPPGTPAQAADAFTLVDFERRGPLLWLAAGFAVLVIALGRARGARALVGLAASVVVVFGFVVPAILAGEAPLGVAVAGALAVMLVTIPLAHGVGAKSLAAIAGTAASLALIVALAVIFVEAAHLTGLASDASQLLLAGREDLSLEGLVLAGMVIGALGVLDDVTVSQASAVMALRRADPTMGFRRLYREALGVGQDHAAATVNTLVLAYVGASLPALLIFGLGDVAPGQALNAESVAEPLVAMLVGSAGLLAAVPITTAVAGALALRLPAHALPPTAGQAHAH
ncbi:MAG TPA: YibE/F family protein [Solirubrobacteraceae bacterium]|nr:YibE/F family protein [Solirubrobacteraceae bacterium]